MSDDDEKKNIDAANIPDKEDEVKFPELSVGPSCFYDRKNKATWLGIPLTQINDPVFLMAAVDRSKISFLNYLVEFIKERTLIAKTSIPNLNSGNFMDRLLKKVVRPS